MVFCHVLLRKEGICCAAAWLDDCRANRGSGALGWHERAPVSVDRATEEVHRRRRSSVNQPCRLLSQSKLLLDSQCFSGHPGTTIGPTVRARVDIVLLLHTAVADRLDRDLSCIPAAFDVHKLSRSA